MEIEITQEWVDRIAKDSTAGAKLSDDNAPTRFCDAWALRYMARLVERGLPVDMAAATYNANDGHDYGDDPAEAADEELSYWGD